LFDGGLKKDVCSVGGPSCWTLPPFRFVTPRPCSSPRFTSNSRYYHPRGSTGGFLAFDATRAEQLDDAACRIEVKLCIVVLSSGLNRGHQAFHKTDPRSIHMSAVRGDFSVASDTTASAEHSDSSTLDSRPTHRSLTWLSLATSLYTAFSRCRRSSSAAGGNGQLVDD
jgi:hypothetical protein